MKSNRIYVVDAFADRPFVGNPAAVLPMTEGEAQDACLMQLIALEMNLAETAFVIPMPDLGQDHFGLRWFTPAVEVELCGHATLAAAHILWETGSVKSGQRISFHTLSGVLLADPVKNAIHLNFPAERAVGECLPRLPKFLGEPVFTGRNRMDWLVELKPGTDLTQLSPNLLEIESLGMRGLIVTSASPGGSEVDFVSRFFAPQSGVNEDPVTGSAHCCLGPYWAEKLGKLELKGYQASARGGVVSVIVRDDRVILGGRAVTSLEGTLRCI